MAEVGDHLATKAAAAVAQMSARYAAKDSKVEENVRELQDLQMKWRVEDRHLLEWLGVGNKTREDDARKKMGDYDLQMKAVKERLDSVSRFAEFAGLKYASVEETQELLHADEALLTFTFGDYGSYLFVVRQNQANFITLSIKRSEVTETVVALRESLDAKGQPLVTLPPFDVVRAHDLYKKLLGPAEEFIKDAKHLIVVPDGPLQSLPLSVLVTEPPNGQIKSMADYKAISWLVRRHAVSVVPGVSSFVQLRERVDGKTARSPFAGFGDPILNDPRKNEPGKLIDLDRGDEVSDEGRRSLPRRTETAYELNAQAKALCAPTTSVHLGREATATAVQTLDLSDTRVLSFATHALMAGEKPFKLAEPALVLTRPADPALEDDGFLRASQVSQLKLAVDWVVLSACNTAAGDDSGGAEAEGLSGLAKAFFYGGAKSLLVSQWPVNSAAAVRLTTGAFRALAADPKIGRAEALRRSMLTMINGRYESWNAMKSVCNLTKTKKKDDTRKIATVRDSASSVNSRPFDAHPLFWAPFVLVGEGN